MSSQQMYKEVITNVSLQFCTALVWPSTISTFWIAHLNSNVIILDKHQPTTSSNVLLRSESDMCTGLQNLQMGFLRETLMSSECRGDSPLVFYMS